ncbi:unnamed protein product [Calypogeia fissa]
MTMRRCRHTLAIFLILAALSTTCNRNKKIVKSEVIWPEDLCQLGKFLSSEASVEDLHLMTPAEISAEKDRPSAVVHGLERSLLGNGAHREVHSEISVELDLGLDIPEGSVTDDCDLVLLERLSKGVFADPFQLNRLQQQKAVKHVQIYGDVDLERPARNSFQSIVELHQSLSAQRAIF